MSCPSPARAAVRSAILHLGCQFERLIVVAALQDEAKCDQFRELIPKAQPSRQLDEALVQQHQDIFADWLDLSFDEQLSDLETYADLHGQTAETISREWLSAETRDSLAPRDVLPMQMRLFRSQADLLVNVTSW